MASGSESGRAVDSGAQYGAQAASGFKAREGGGDSREFVGTRLTTSEAHSFVDWVARNHDKGARFDLEIKFVPAEKAGRARWNEEGHAPCELSPFGQTTSDDEYGESVRPGGRVPDGEVEIRQSHLSEEAPGTTYVRGVRSMEGWGDLLHSERARMILGAQATQRTKETMEKREAAANMDITGIPVLGVGDSSGKKRVLGGIASDRDPDVFNPTPSREKAKEKVPVPSKAEENPLTIFTADPRGPLKAFQGQDTFLPTNISSDLESGRADGFGQRWVQIGRGSIEWRCFEKSSLMAHEVPACADPVVRRYPRGTPFTVNVIPSMKGEDGPATMEGWAAKERYLATMRASDADPFAFNPNPRIEPSFDDSMHIDGDQQRTGRQEKADELREDDAQSPRMAQSPVEGPDASVELVTDESLEKDHTSVAASAPAVGVSSAKPLGSKRKLRQKGDSSSPERPPSKSYRAH